MTYPAVASHQPPEYPDSTVPFPDFPGRHSLSPELDRQISELISAMEAAREASDRVRRLFCRSLYPCIKRELGSLREGGPPGDAKVGGENGGEGGENGGEGGGKRASTQGEEVGRAERLEDDGENGLDGNSKGSSLIVHDNSLGMDKRVTSVWRSKVRIPTGTEQEEEDKAVEEVAEEVEEDGGEEGKEDERKEEETRQGLGSKEPTKVGLPYGRGVSASVLPFGAPIDAVGISVPEAAEEESGGERVAGRLEGARRRVEPAKHGDGAASVPAAVSAFPEAETGSAKEEKCLRGLDEQHDDIDASDTDSEEDHHVLDSQRKRSDGLPEGDSCTPSSATAAAAATMAALERKHGAKGKYQVGGESAMNLEVRGKRPGEMKSMGQYRDEIFYRDEAETRVAADVAVIGDLPVASKGAGAVSVVVGHAVGVGVHAEAKGEGGTGAAGADGAGAVRDSGAAGEEVIGGSARARRSSSTSSSSRSSSGGDGVGSGRVWRGRGDGESMDRQNSLQQQQEEEEEVQKEQQEQGLLQQRQGHQGQVLLDFDGMDEDDGARGALGVVGAAGVRQSSERKKRGANGGATTAEVLDVSMVLPGRPPLPRTAGTAAELGEKRQGGAKTSRWRCAKTVGSSTVAAAGGTGAAGVGNCDIDLLDSPERAAWDRIAGGGGVGAGANGVRKQGGRRGEGGAKGGSGGGAVGASGPPPPYKYVDVVRKKSDREALQAGECETCRKFYDAILDGDVDGVMVPRCEQHQEASRHRYRFAPPSTPPGFWNVGFDSDL
ncbi:unnamed protein product [Closterium sp. Naga37s-1]|nr:unnamed protein product [Closterium sp. Naga37s-1]